MEAQRPRESSPDRARREALEARQVELREARAVLAVVTAEAGEALAEVERAVNAAEARCTAAEARVAALTTEQEQLERHIAATLKAIREARLERDGPVERVGLYNEEPEARDWASSETARRQQAKIAAVAWGVGAAVVLIASLSRSC